MISQLTLFDYASLDSETRIVVQQRTEEIKTLMRRTAQDIIDIGQKLIDVKTRLGYGGFGSWLQTEFGWDERQAQRFIKVAEWSSKTDKLSDLNFAPSALYLLSAPSTPEEARTEAIERAEAGETITYSVGKKIVDTHKKEQSPEPDKTDAQEPPKQETSLNFSQVDAQVIPPPSTQGSYTPDVSQFTAVGGHIVPKSALEPTEGQSAPSNNAEKMAVHYSSETPEHYTPRVVIDLVLEFWSVEKVDLDPCSNSHEAPNFPAYEVFTKSDDGLSQIWLAETLFMNPPYGREIDAWAEKLIAEHEAGNVKQALALVPGRIDTQWFHRFYGYPACFVSGRLKFIGNDDAAPFPSVLFYLGQDKKRFAQFFNGFGDIWGAYS